MESPIFISYPVKSSINRNCAKFPNFEYKKLTIMSMINVSVDSKEPLHDGVTDLFKISRKLLPNFRGEDCVIVQLVLDIRHNIVNVHRSTSLNTKTNI